MVRGTDVRHPKSRAEYYKSGILTGWMTRNEVRQLENLPPVDGI